MIVTLGGFARRFTVIGMAAGVGLGLVLGSAIDDRLVNVTVAVVFGVIALVLVRSAVQLKVKPSKEDEV